MISVQIVGTDTVLIVDEPGLDSLAPHQKAAIMYWCLRPSRIVFKGEGQSLFPNYDHVVFVRPTKRHDQPTPPLDVEHEDIRSERPCT